MCCGDLVVFCKTQQDAGQSGVKTSQGDILDQLFEIGKAAGNCGQDFGAEGWIIGHFAAEKRMGHDLALDIGLGDTFGGIAAPLGQAGKCLQADIAGGYPVQHHLAPVGGRQGDADGAAVQADKARAVLARAKQHSAGGAV